VEARQREEARRREEVRFQEAARRKKELSGQEIAELQSEARMSADMLDAKRQEIRTKRFDPITSKSAETLHSTTGKRVPEHVKGRKEELVIYERVKSDVLQELHNKLIEELKKCPANLSAVINCLDDGADINFHEKGITPPLIYAVINQNDFIAEYLLNQGANPLIANSHGEIASDYVSQSSPLYSLLKTKEKEFRFLALSKKERLSLELQEYICMCDAKIQKIDEYLALGADIDYQNPNGFTSLMLAIDAQNERIAEYLLKYGANPLLKNKYGKTAKQLVSRFGAMFQILKGYEFLFVATESNIALMRSLLKADKSILDFQGRDGYTALLIATEQGDIDTINYLLQEGADTSITSDDGKGITELAYDKSIIELFFGDEEEPLSEDFTSSNRYLFFEDISSTESSEFQSNPEQISLVD
jgi:ankyrin repeat protein